MATPLCTSSQSHWAAPSAGWVVLSGGGRLAATGTQASKRVVACAPAPADGRRTSAPGEVSVPGVDSVEAVAAGRAAVKTKVADNRAVQVEVRAAKAVDRVSQVAAASPAAARLWCRVLPVAC